MIHCRKEKVCELKQLWLSATSQKNQERAYFKLRIARFKLNQLIIKSFLKPSLHQPWSHPSKSWLQDTQKLEVKHRTVYLLSTWQDILRVEFWVNANVQSLEHPNSAKAKILLALTLRWLSLKNMSTADSVAPTHSRIRRKSHNIVMYGQLSTYSIFV